MRLVEETPLGLLMVETKLTSDHVTKDLRGYVCGDLRVS